MSQIDAGTGHADYGNIKGSGIRLKGTAFPAGCLRGIEKAQGSPHSVFFDLSCAGGAWPQQDQGPIVLSTRKTRSTVSVQLYRSTVGAPKSLQARQHRRLVPP